MKNVGVVEQVVASDPLVSGTMVHYLSGTLDAVTGEGPLHGTITLTPTVDVQSRWDLFQVTPQGCGTWKRRDS
jgi:hypothetical protein